MCRWDGRLSCQHHGAFRGVRCQHDPCRASPCRPCDPHWRRREVGGRQARPKSASSGCGPLRNAAHNAAGEAHRAAAAPRPMAALRWACGRADPRSVNPRASPRPGLAVPARSLSGSRRWSRISGQPGVSHAPDLPARDRHRRPIIFAFIGIFAPDLRRRHAARTVVGQARPTSTPARSLIIGRPGRGHRLHSHRSRARAWQGAVPMLLIRFQHGERADHAGRHPRRRATSTTRTTQWRFSRIPARSGSPISRFFPLVLIDVSAARSRRSSRSRRCWIRTTLLVAFGSRRGPPKIIPSAQMDGTSPTPPHRTSSPTARPRRIFLDLRHLVPRPSRSAGIHAGPRRRDHQSPPGWPRRSAL